MKFSQNKREKKKTKYKRGNFASLNICASKIKYMRSYAIHCLMWHWIRLTLWRIHSKRTFQLPEHVQGNSNKKRIPSFLVVFAGFCVCGRPIKSMCEMNDICCHNCRQINATHTTHSLCVRIARDTIHQTDYNFAHHLFWNLVLLPKNMLEKRSQYSSVHGKYLHASLKLFKWCSHYLSPVSAPCGPIRCWMCVVRATNWKNFYSHT